MVSLICFAFSYEEFSMFSILLKPFFVLMILAQNGKEENCLSSG